VRAILRHDAVNGRDRVTDEMANFTTTLRSDRKGSPRVFPDSHDEKQ